MNTTDSYTNKGREAVLRRYNEAYRNGTPEISDVEYDKLWREHQEARAADPAGFPTDTILDKVGAAPARDSGFQKVKHSTPMLSLDNVFEDEEDGCPDLNAWLAGIEKEEPDAAILIEPKIDGLSLRLTYVGGLLMRAVTRGSGEEGDDVSANVAVSRLVPMSIAGQPGQLEVNGEVFMDFATFARLNAELVAKGEEPYTNPRNAAAGALRLHDSAECARRGLRFIPHGVVGGNADHSTMMTSLGAAGFECLEEVGMMATERIKSIAATRRMAATDLGYPIDGLVFKVDDRSVCERLGNTSRAPRWAIALKFQQEKVVTKLKAITIQVGRSGVLTPVAELEPVWVDGSTISRATLHNEDQVRRLGLCVGDDVEVRKAGAVIPEIVSSATLRKCQEHLYEFFRDKHTDYTPEELTAHVRLAISDERPPFDLVQHIGGKCPSCGGTDIQRAAPAGGHSDHEDTPTVAYRCMNPSCPAQLAARIQHFCSRKCLDIEGIGEEAAEAIAEGITFFGPEAASFAATPMSLFEMTQQMFADLRWTTAAGGTMTFGASRARKVMAALEAAKKLPLHRWLFALGIPSVGENTSKEISRLFKSAEHLLTLLFEDTSEAVAQAVYARIIPGPPQLQAEYDRYQISGRLGPDSSQKLIDYVQSPGGQETLRLLAQWDIKSDNYNPIPVKVETGSPLNGKTVVITGTLSVSRDEMKALLEQAGAKVGGSVSAKTNFLVVGEKAGSKADKAAKLGVTVLTEAEARAML